MKKFITTFVILAIGLLLGAAGYKMALEENWLPQKDPLGAEYVQDEQLADATFTNVSDIVTHHDSCVEEFLIDSVFRSMSPSTLMNAASTCIARTGYVSVKSVVEEYRANNIIYNSIVTSPTAITQTNSDLQEEAPRIRNDTAVEKLDTIATTNITSKNT